MSGTTDHVDQPAESPWLTTPTVLDERMLPALTTESEAYWTGLDRGALVLDRCTECARVTFPPVGGCSFCGAATLEPYEAPLRGEVYSYTVCHLAFGTGMETPYVVAVVAPEGSPEARIATNVVECRVDEVSIGMQVEMFVVNGESQSLLFARPPANGSLGDAATPQEVTDGP